MTNSDFRAALMRVAAFYSVNPGFPAPEWTWPFRIYCSDKAKFAELVRVLGGDKVYTDETVAVERQFGDLKVSVVAQRVDVCEKVKVGTKVVPARHVPAKTEPARFEPEHEEEVYEWVCAPILGDGGKE